MCPPETSSSVTATFGRCPARSPGSANCAPPGKKIALAGSGERARAAVELAGVADLFDAIVTGPRNTGTLAEVTAALGVEASDAILVDVAPAGIEAGHASQFDLLIGVARNLGTPEDLRHAGADMVVADLQELLGSAQGLDR
ncbi:MAG TPA: hypothetical protein VH299_10125 [Solirubrobacterales bacterium]|nr:hypothetical protein [Solirubrobacterales bacterium]